MTETPAYPASHQLMIESSTFTYVDDERRWTTVASCSCGDWFTVTGYATRAKSVQAMNGTHRSHLVGLP